MVGMVVGDENAAELESAGLNGGNHRHRIAWVDHGRVGAIFNEPNVVILKRWNGYDVKHNDR